MAAQKTDLARRKPQTWPDKTHETQREQASSPPYLAVSLTCFAVSSHPSYQREHYCIDDSGVRNKFLPMSLSLSLLCSPSDPIHPRQVPGANTMHPPSRHARPWMPSTRRTLKPMWPRYPLRSAPPARCFTETPS
ncbi:hypothetical protein BGZ61DRAFT_444528 [Ilyonectria robusta]|uniref:uncharacterized protein n=1 Tax=Ilyonectria robusta TaxID=1079257 RepID=UPI001E8D9BEE|nr:uncharacterized protein BGZ61DRAFT_444528 [Ilyonectria robusta]KAH8733420.1 hypothetical protein BGZ61DRAFT_444528 [Ilyonectria robusta]